MALNCPLLGAQPALCEVPLISTCQRAISWSSSLPVMLLITVCALLFLCIIPAQCPLQYLIHSRCAVNACWKNSWEFSKWENQFTKILHAEWLYLHKTLENANESDPKKAVAWGWAGVWERGGPQRGVRECLGVLDVLVFFIGMIASPVDMYVRSHQTVHFMCDVLYIIVLNKAIKTG